MRWMLNNIYWDEPLFFDDEEDALAYRRSMEEDKWNVYLLDKITLEVIE